MKKILLTFWVITISAICSAGEIGYPNPDGTVQTIVYDDKYSFKDFTQRNLLEAEDLEGMVIFGSSFSQENPDTRVFPDKVKKMTFYNCNLSNVFMVKPGWIVIGGTERRYKVQNDLKDWEVDNTEKPIKVINEEDWIRQGYDVNPSKIPLTKIEKVEDGPKAVIPVIE